MIAPVTTPGRSKHRMTRPTAAPEPVNCSTNQSKAMMVNWSPRYDRGQPQPEPHERGIAQWRSRAGAELRQHLAKPATPRDWPLAYDVVVVVAPKRSAARRHRHRRPNGPRGWSVIALATV